jgi:hypothetical protein
VRIDCRAFFRLDTGIPHAASDLLAEGADLCVGKPAFTIDDRDPIGMKVGSLIEVIDGSHFCAKCLRHSGL